MTKEEIKSLLSLSRLPCEKACEWAAGRNPDKLELVAAAKYDWREWVAFYTSDPEILAMLASDWSRRARCAVARNPYTSAGVRAILAADSDEDVRYIATYHLNTPAEATT